MDVHKVYFKVFYYNYMKENFNLKTWVENHKVIAIILILAIVVIGSKVINKDYRQSVSIVSTEEKNSTSTPKTELLPTQDWVKIISLDAEANKQSEIFHLAGGEQKLVYKASGGKYLLCYIYIVPKNQSIDLNGGFPEVKIDVTSASEVFIKKNSGDYYLDIKVVNGTCGAELQEIRHDK